MSIGRMVGRACVAAGAVAVTGGMTAVPAQADCVYVEAYVTVEGGAPIYVAGEDDPCITETEWTWLTVMPGGVRKGGLPEGTPNGFVVDIRVPSPV